MDEATRAAAARESGSAAAAARACLVGLPVAYAGLAGEKTVAAADAAAANAAAKPAAAFAAPVVHDGVMRVLGFTLLHDVPSLLAALSESSEKDVDVPTMLLAISSWLTATPRLYEVRGGATACRRLDCAALVRVDAKAERVVEVLHDVHDARIGEE